MTRGAHCTRRIARAYGDDGRGDGFNAQYLDPKPTDLTNAEHMSKNGWMIPTMFYTSAVFFDKSHRMLPWGGTSSDDLWALVRQHPDAPNCSEPTWAEMAVDESAGNGTAHSNVCLRSLQ